MQVFSTSPVAVYSGVGNAFTRISATEGMRALWKGVSSVALGAGPAHAIHFGVLEAVKDVAGGNEAGSQFLATCTHHCYCYPIRGLTCRISIGRCICNDCCGRLYEPLRRHQTADAASQIRIPQRLPVRKLDLPQRRLFSILHILSYDTRHLNTLQRRSILCLRTHQTVPQSHRPIFTQYAYRSRCYCRSCCRSCNNAVGCRKNHASDAWVLHRPRNSECSRDQRCYEDHLPEGGSQRFRSRTYASRLNHHAKHSFVLAFV